MTNNDQDLLSYNLIKHRDGHKEQNTGQPETWIMKVKENYKQLSKRSMNSFYQSFSSLFANPLKLHSRRYMFLRKRRSFEYRHCRCLARIAIALNRCSVYEQIQYTKPPEHLCLLNIKLLQLVLVRVLTWSCYMIGVNFDLLKLMPVEHIFLMPLSCLSLILIHARIHTNKLLITAQPIRNLWTPASTEMNKRGLL